MRKILFLLCLITMGCSKPSIAVSSAASFSTGLVAVNCAEDVPFPKCIDAASKKCKWMGFSGEVEVSNRKVDDGSHPHLVLILNCK